jgi:hypothetical protein
MGVQERIKSIYQIRRKQIYALSLYYSALAIKYFRQQQASDKYWTNQTFLAMDLMFTGAFIERDIIGWFMSHGVQYGVYLEIANDRRNEAIRPIVQRFAPRFFADVRKIYGDS